MKDYIIVGLGLAGLAFAEMLEKNNKSFVVINNNSQNASKVAAGMYNPVILKRFTAVWQGKKQIDYALPFYENLEKKLNNKFIFNVDIYKIFKTLAQQNEWFTACDKPILKDFMQAKIFQNKNNAIVAPFGFGKLINTGKIETEILLNKYKEYLIIQNKYAEETFDYKKLIINNNQVKYKDIIAKRIVFCEGFGVKTNPLFNNLPLNEAKGELLIIKATNLKIDFMLKGAVFVMPLGNDLYKVGATFNWQDKTVKPTKQGKEELITKLNKVIKTNYTIEKQLAGIRPTVKDRRPLIGIHSNYKNVGILNGLGTRGVMLAPTMANLLFQHIENQTVLDLEIDIKRFN